MYKDNFKKNQVKRFQAVTDAVPNKLKPSVISHCILRRRGWGEPLTHQFLTKQTAVTGILVLQMKFTIIIFKSENVFVLKNKCVTVRENVIFQNTFLWFSGNLKVWVMSF